MSAYQSLLNAVIQNTAAIENHAHAQATTEADARRTIQNQFDATKPLALDPADVIEFWKQTLNDETRLREFLQSTGAKMAIEYYGQGAGASSVPYDELMILAQYYEVTPNGPWVHTPPSLTLDISRVANHSAKTLSTLGLKVIDQAIDAILGNIDKNGRVHCVLCTVWSKDVVTRLICHEGNEIAYGLTLAKARALQAATIEIDRENITTSARVYGEAYEHRASMAPLAGRVFDASLRKIMQEDELIKKIGADEYSSFLRYFAENSPTAKEIRPQLKIRRAFALDQYSDKDETKSVKNLLDGITQEDASKALKQGYIPQEFYARLNLLPENAGRMARFLGRFQSPLKTITKAPRKKEVGHPAGF